MTGTRWMRGLSALLMMVVVAVGAGMSDPASADGTPCAPQGRDLSNDMLPPPPVPAPLTNDVPPLPTVPPLTSSTTTSSTTTSATTTTAMPAAPVHGAGAGAPAALDQGCPSGAGRELALTGADTTGQLVVASALLTLGTLTWASTRRRART